MLLIKTNTTGKIQFVLIAILFFSFISDSFKDEQLKYPRVRQAYIDKESDMLSLLQDNHLDRRKLQIYLRAFKSEKQIELWGKNNSGDKYILIKTYRICIKIKILGIWVGIYFHI